MKSESGSCGTIISGSREEGVGLTKLCCEREECGKKSS